MQAQTQNKEFIPDENGNFSSPALRALEDVWDDLDAGATDPTEVQMVIERVEAFVREKISEMERDGQAQSVDLLDPNRVAILGAFQDHLTGLKVMKEGLNEEDYDSVDHSFDLIQSATNRMVTGLSSIVEDGDRYVLIRCVRCSAENEKGTGFCCGCGAILPKVEQEKDRRVIAVASEEQSRDEETTPNFIEVSEAHEDWEAGRVEPEQFYKVIQQVRERQVGQYEEVQRELSNDHSSREHLQSFLSALEQAAEALDQMLLGLEEADVSRVDSGLNDYAEATIRLMDLDREADDSVEQLEEIAS